MSTVTRRETIETSTMDALYEGGYAQRDLTKRAWCCDGCGLVWTRRSQAESCESRGHVPQYVDTYYYQVVIEGHAQIVEQSYPRVALRRELVRPRVVDRMGPGARRLRARSCERAAA